MSGYVRPVIAEHAYRDDDGVVIDYGSQWRDVDPPPDRYSVDSHPERFAPLHQIAESLIEYLKRTYAVKVTDDLSCVDDLIRPPVNAVVRSVRLTPAAADATKLTFVFTGYPGLIVHAGLLHDFGYPQCGCDACDETWQSVADELESNVLAIVSGGYREEVRRVEHTPWIWSQLRTMDGSLTEAGGIAASFDRELLSAASARLQTLPQGWAPWPHR